MKRILIIIITALVISLGLSSCRNSNRLTSDDYGSFSIATKQYSFDETYYSIQEIEDGMVHISIYTASDDELISEVEPCRSWDYWGMVWENDRNAFWIQSADIGIFCIEQVDGEWVENHECERPDYIVSRYDSLIEAN